MEKLKRLFFALEMKAPWPETIPPGRTIFEENRHLTLAFLGDASFYSLEKQLHSFPKPPFKVGPAGAFTKLLFLPKRTPRVAAWEIEWWEKESRLLEYRRAVNAWLGLQMQDEFLSHVSIARNPTHFEEWEQSFTPLPCFAKDMCLFESLGSSQYKSLWKISLLPPFEEIDHMADIAFLIRGESLEELYVHGWLALSFFEPVLSEYFVSAQPSSQLHMIELFNAQIARIDADRGCPLKAVSQHGTIQNNEGLLEWEMIADV